MFTFKNRSELSDNSPSGGAGQKEFMRSLRMSRIYIIYYCEYCEYSDNFRTKRSQNILKTSRV